MGKWILITGIVVAVGGFWLESMEKDYNAKHCIDEFDTNDCHMSKIKAYPELQKAK